MTWIISRAMMKAYENSPCSQGLVEEYWEENYSDGERFAPLNVIVTPHPFWLRDKMTDILSHSRFGAMSRRLTDGIGEDVLTWFQVGFRAKTSPQPEKAQGSEENEADCGERWLALSVKYDPGTHGWKTHHCLFPEDLDWSCLTLPKWGMLANGELWERTTQEPDTSGIGAGCGESWPTPKTRDWKDSMGASLDATNPDGSHRDRRDRLMGAIVDRQSYPTPTSSMVTEADMEQARFSGNDPRRPSYQEAKNYPTPDVRGFTNEGSLSMLSGMVSREEFDGMGYRACKSKKDRIWATPTASAGGPEPDGKTGRKLATQVHSFPTPTATAGTYDLNWKATDGRAKPNKLGWAVKEKAKKHSFPSPGTTGMSNGSGNCEKSNKLHEAGVITDDERKSMRAGNGGQLNPDWVEWLMGWPVAWTRLENTYTNWMNWEVDPADIDVVPRIATDIPNRIDRLRAIGNGQVPQAMVLAWHELTTNKEK
jgi:hypothetical protein